MIDLFFKKGKEKCLVSGIEIQDFHFEAMKNDILGMLRKYIQKLEKKIKAIERNPKNEGQVYFLSEKSSIKRDIEQIKRCIKEIEQ